MSTGTRQQSPEKEVEEKLLAFIRLLVDSPEKVKITALVGQQSVSYEIRTASNEVGQLIGKGGKTATAIRQLVKVALAKHHMKSLVSILA